MEREGKGDAREREGYIEGDKGGKKDRRGGKGEERERGLSVSVL